MCACIEGHCAPASPVLACWVQIDFMKEQHYLDKKFNRLRDEQSLFMEESCKFKHMGKHGGTAKVPGKT